MARKSSAAFRDLKACFANGAGESSVVRDPGIDPFCFELLSVVQETLGFTNPVLRGSALYLPVIRGLRGEAAGGKLGDYDVLVNFGGFEEFRRSQARAFGRSPAAGQNLLDYLNCRSVLKNADYKWASAPDCRGCYFIEVTGAYKGRAVDLIVQNAPLDPAVVARTTDAPITGLAMDAQGKIHEHPDFRAHAEGLIYRPSMHTDPVQALDLYRKMEQRFPGLRMERTGADRVEAPVPSGFFQPGWAPV